MSEPHCWRSECRNGCYYPAACSERRNLGVSATKPEAAGRYLPCDVCKGQTSHHRDCPRPVLGPPHCTCNPAEVENGICVLCGNPFPVGGAV